jgi:hypothetical protein
MREPPPKVPLFRVRGQAITAAISSLFRSHYCGLTGNITVRYVSSHRKLRFFPSLGIQPAYICRQGKIVQEQGTPHARRSNMRTERTARRLREVERRLDRLHHALCTRQFFFTHKK